MSATVWCAECEGPSDVVQEGLEEVLELGYVRDYWVILLDCGHEEVSPR